MPDFTPPTLHSLLSAFLDEGFSFTPLSGFTEGSGKKTVILRHDVDRLPANSLATARLEHESGISGSYYFRIVPESYDEWVIREISGIGHEIGYHYEDLTLAGGDVDKAYTSFCRNLEKIRKLVPVTTICMHGSPLSRYDSRDIWAKYDYRKLGITAEPYFDIDFNKTFYLTDTGRRWDGHRVSIRDKAMAGSPVTNPDFLGRSYHTTTGIIGAVEKGDFPNQVMITIHPQRWTSNIFLWSKELITQNLKNQIKRFMVKKLFAK
ncbi:MAG: hypothetical protein ACOYNC_13720 [Bacteroidales bacterium]